MVTKRKSKGKPRKRPKHTSSFIGTIKRMFIGAFFVVVCFIGLLFIYNYFYPLAEKQATPASQKESVAKKQAEPVVVPRTAREEKSPSPASDETFRMPANAEMPRLQAKRQEQIIRHEGYTVSYNSDYRIANWVAYELTADEAKSKKTERSNKFVSDPDVKGTTATNEDYTRTGYDRGHLAPAGDMKWSARAMRESFYLSNICPQNPGLNRGIWKELEEQSRLWAMDNGSLSIVTGPVITDDMKRMGKNQVAIPRSFYKVICYQAGNKYTGVAFIFKNEDYKKVELKAMAIPIDSVEKVTGIDFFSAFPDDMEQEMEATVDWNNWSF